MMTKEKAADLARGRGWLAAQPVRFQEDLLARCHLRSYREKEALYHVGDPCTGVFCLVSGAIKVEFAALGGEYKTAAVKQPVCWFGQGACFRRAGYLVAVTAATAITVLHLPVHEFERLIENPAHCRSFALLTLDHLDEALLVLGQMLIGDVEGKIAARLTLLADAPGQGQPIVVPITQQDLAEMCGLSRPTVQQALASLERRGLVRAGYRKIEILDLPNLLGHRGNAVAMTAATKIA